MKAFRGSTHIKDLSEATAVGTRYKVEWVDVPDRDARTTSVRKQFTTDDITRARKLEGQWWGDGGAYFVSSFARISDGSVNAHDGQVWHYDPATESITLNTIFGVNPDPDQNGALDGPDNITVAPQGGLILAEDGHGVSHLVGVTDQGMSYPLARNEYNDSEFCGPIVQQGRQVALRQHPVPRLHPCHHRALDPPIQRLHHRRLDAPCTGGNPCCGGCRRSSQ